MRCMKCGTVIQSGTICPHCGNDASAKESVEFVETTQDVVTEESTESAPVSIPKKLSSQDATIAQSADTLIKYFKVILVLNVFLFLKNAYSIFSGEMYDGKENMQATYDYFGSALKYTDSFAAVLSIILAVFCLVTAYSVHKKKNYSIILVIALYVVATLTDLIYGGLVWKITGINVMFNAKFFISLAIRVLFAYVYIGAFKKRAEEFVN